MRVRVIVGTNSRIMPKEGATLAEQNSRELTGSLWEATLYLLLFSTRLNTTILIMFKRLPSSLI